MRCFVKAANVLVAAESNAVEPIKDDRQNMSRGANGNGNGHTGENGTPKAVVARLSLYLRHLEAMLKAGDETVSSNRLGTALEITDAQVRKDLANFGQFGYPGIGYRVCELRDSIRSVLGTNHDWNVALIGVGNIGRALLGYSGFVERGFHIVAAFDNNPELIGQRVGEVEVFAIADLPRLARELDLEMAILAVPTNGLETAMAAVADAGLAGILNFAPTQPRVPPELSVVSVDLGQHLEQLAFQVTKRRTAQALEASA